MQISNVKILVIYLLFMIATISYHILDMDAEAVIITNTINTNPLVIIEAIETDEIFEFVELNSISKIKVSQAGTSEQRRKRENTTVSENEFLCLAKNIFYEARNQSVEGKTAIADVTLNRVAHSRYPDTICGVVKQPYQFSWYTKKKMIAPIPENVIASNAWKESKKVARRAVVNRNTVVPPNVMYFHAVYVKPSWAQSMKRVSRIDDHIFYERNRKSI